MIIYAFIVVLLIVIFLVLIQPLLVLYFAWRDTNFSERYLQETLPYGTDISGFAGLPDFSKGDLLIGLATGEENCENGFYVGNSEMINIDCTRICNATSSKQFEYKYITGNNIIVNNQYLRKGGWCLPTALARCNLNISLAVKSLGRYECISKFPQLLGGPYGNEIHGCAPIYEFNDNLKKIIYTHNVPSSLVIGDINETLPNNHDTMRYTCNTSFKFETFYNRPDLGNRFQLFYDSCNFFDPGGKMIGSKCHCSQAVPNTVIKPLQSKNMPTGKTTQICSTCTSGYGIIDEKFPQYGSKYGVSIGIDCVDPERIEYYKTIAIDQNGVIPCGMKTLLNLRENSTSKHYGCHRTLINVTNSYTPEMLQRING